MKERSAKRKRGLRNIWEAVALRLYFLGTREEIEAYQSNASKSYARREFNAAFVASDVLGLLGLPYTLSLVADVVARAGVAYAKKDADVFSRKGIREAATSPGLVGIIREGIE